MAGKWQRKWQPRWVGALPALPLRRLWLVLLSFAAQNLIVTVVPRTGAWEPWRGALIVLASMPLLFWAWSNRRWVGVWLLALGLVLNLTVMLANGGLMPIDPRSVLGAGLQAQVASTSLGQALPHSKDVLLTVGATHLSVLRDQIVLRGSPIFGRVLSPGDLVLFAGLIVTILEVLRSILAQPARAREKPATVRQL